MEEGAKGVMSHDEDILTLNVDEKALEEEMECEREDETVQDAERVSTISNPSQPTKKEREKHEATHAQYRGWCIACERERGIAMRHHRGIGAGNDEGKLHTFVMDYGFPTQGSQQGIIVLVVKETKTNAINTFMVPNNGANENLKTVVDFMSGCGCGRAILKSYGEPAIVALQEAVKNSRQSDTILENSPKGDSQSNGAAENAESEAEGMIRTWRMCVEEKLKAVIDNKQVLLPWLVMHKGVIITRYKTVHDGKTAYQRIKNKRPSNKMQPFGVKVVWMMPKDNHRRNKLDSIHQFGVFVGIVPRTKKFVALTLEGAVVVRTLHKLSEDPKRDTEFVSKVECALWDFKANAGDGINDDGILERVDARPPDPSIEIPSRINVRRMCIRKMDVDKNGLTKGCPSCHKVTWGTVPSCIMATHSDACRERMERLMMQDPVGPSGQDKNTS